MTEGMKRRRIFPASESAGDWVVFLQEARRRSSSRSVPEEVVRRRMVPSRMREPARIFAPGWRGLGKGSPVWASCSTKASPLSMMPSAGMISPGRISRIWPAVTLEMGASERPVLEKILAVERRPGI